MMNVKTVDLSDKNIWGINQKLRNLGVFNLSELHDIVDYLEKRDSRHYQLATKLNISTGFACWQIVEI